MSEDAEEEDISEEAEEEEEEEEEINEKENEEYISADAEDNTSKNLKASDEAQDK